VIVRQELRLLVPVIVFIVFLITINWDLKIQLEGLEKAYSLEQSGEEYRELQKYEDKFSDVNYRISSISKLQSGHLYWSNIFYRLSDLVPEGIYMNNAVTKDYKVSLAGRARTRDDLLAFQEKMESSDCFTKLNVPLSNLVSRENVDFRIDFEVEANCLKNK
jgi:Tfp pilus assembly protein PilN